MTFKINPEVIFNEKDSEDKTILIDLAEDRDIYFQLTGVGREFWKLINKGMEKATIVERVCDSYDVEESKVEADFDRFIEDLKEKKVLL